MNRLQPGDWARIRFTGDVWDENLHGRTGTVTRDIPTWYGNHDDGYWADHYELLLDKPLDDGTRHVALAPSDLVLIQPAGILAIASGADTATVVAIHDYPGHRFEVLCSHCMVHGGGFLSWTYDLGITSAELRRLRNETATSAAKHAADKHNAAGVDDAGALT